MLYHSTLVFTHYAGFPLILIGCHSPGPIIPRKFGLSVPQPPGGTLDSPNLFPIMYSEHFVRVCVCACVCVNGRVCFLVVLFYPLFSCIQYAVHYTVCTVQYNVRKYNNSLPGELHCDKNACSALCTQVCCKFIFLGITRNPNLNLGMVLVIIMSIPKFKLVKLGYF